MNDSCSNCHKSLMSADLREGPEHPEVGYVYYECPECGHIMPGPPGASPSTESPAYWPGDPNWRQNPRAYHEQMNLQEAVFNIIKDESASEGVGWTTITAIAEDYYELTTDETGEIIEDLIQRGRCTEPAPNRLQV